MKANGLMEGNFIYNKDGEIEKVYTLYRDGINGYDGEGGIIPDDEELFKPIPLTEQWLIDFGCKIELKKYKTKTATKGNIQIYYHKGWRFIINDFDSIVLKYVHQYQNLYFALTGKELIKK